jgi:transcriptional regulator with XRE-family HTH domain
MGLIEKKLGKRVAELRQAADFTQAKLAEKIGVATETVSRLERGAAMPSLSRIEGIAAALKVDLHEIFRFREGNTAKSAAVARMIAAVRDRSAADTAELAEIVARIAARWR